MPKTTKIKVGDRVKIVDIKDGTDIGDLGTVKSIKKSEEGVSTTYPDGNYYAVEFDKTYPDGHDCDGHCIDERGLWMSSKNIKGAGKGRKIKVPKKIYHVVCNENDPRSVQGVRDSYDDAVGFKPGDNPYIVYEMIPVAKIERSIKVSKIKVTKKKSK